MTGPVTTEALAEFQRRNGYHRREIEELLTEFGELVLATAEASLQQVTAERDAKTDVLAEMKLCAEATADERERLLSELARLRAEGEAKDRALKVALEAYDAAVRVSANAEAVRQDVLGRQSDHPDIGEIMDQVGAEESCMRAMAARGIARADLVAAVRTALARAATAREGA